MKKRYLKVFLMSVLFSLTIALTGCSGDKAKEESSSEITIGIAQDIEDSLDPHKAVAAGTKEILFNVFEGLVKPDTDGNLIDAVASAHTISEDGKVYTFTLRDGVKFHDGSPVTAEDVKYSITRCADTENGEPLVAAFSNIESVNIVDEKTVEIKLIEADTDFLAYMTTAIIPKGNETPDTTPIGTGPYQYVSRSPQENIILKKFNDYWGTPANIENVTLKVIADADSIAMNLNGGAIDMFFRVTTAQMNELSDDFEIYEGTMNLVQAVYLNHDFEPFKDARVRQALCYAINKDEILEMVSDGKGSQIGSNMFPAFSKYFDESLNDLYPTDVEKAKTLLAEAGYADLTFTIRVPSNYQQHVDTAQVVAQQLKQAGVTANIELVEWDTWLTDVYADGNYEATVVGLEASSLTPRALLERFESTSSKNFIHYMSEAYDTALINAMTTTNDEEKTAYYKECLQILAQDAANMYVQDLPEFIALNKKYAGYEFYPMYVQDFAKLYIVEEQ